VRARRLTAVLALLAGCSLSACAGGDPGLEAAQTACRAYAGTERQQAATTLDETDAVRASARDQADRAAAEDDAWAELPSDIDRAYAHRAASAAAHNAGDVEESGREVEAYQAADERVRADCADADEDFGPLQP
jgi:hypothetical protein